MVFCSLVRYGGAAASSGPSVDLGGDASDALEFAKTMGIVEGLLEELDEDAGATAMSNLADLFHEHATDGVLLGSAAWLIKARTR